MKIEVAVIGSASLTEKIKQNAAVVSNLQLHYFTYNELVEVKQLVQQASKVADIFLFTGIIPYQIAKADVDALKKAAFYLKLDDYSVLLGLYEALAANKDVTFSMDYTSDVNLQSILSDLRIPASRVFAIGIKEIFEDEGLDYSEKIMQFHEKLYRTRQVDKIVTCLSTVSSYLAEKGIPHIRIMHSNNVILDTLTSIVQYKQLVATRSSQLFIAKYRIDDYDVVLKEQGAYILEQNILELNKILLDVASETFSMLQRTHRDEFTIYGTYGAFIDETKNLLDFRHLAIIEKLVQLSVSVGFGTGYTAKDAENHAMQALQFSSRVHAPEGYLMNEKGQLHGPFNSQMITNELLTDTMDDHWVLKASKTGISIQVLDRIVRYYKLHEDVGFTATDLAEYLMTGKRSAERYLKILVDNELVVEVGMRQTGNRGRHAKLYQLVGA